MLCNIIHKAAITQIGRETINDISKPWISSEIVSIMKQLKNGRKGISTKMLNRVKNIKR